MFSRKEISVLEPCGNANVFPPADRRQPGFQMWAVPNQERAGTKGGPQGPGLSSP